MKKDIKSRLPDELRDELIALGQPAFRAKQIFKWLHRGARSFDEMTDISKALRAMLAEHYFLTPPEVAQKRESAQDGTIKYLWKLHDGETVESVLMSYKHGESVCVSSQVGCARGCAFCASTIGGLVRNLEPSEILDQVLFTGIDSGRRISNIVLMGIGEPLDNFDNVMRFLELVTHADGLNIGARHISLSTCAPAGQVDKLSDYGLQLTLSVSLHAPDDATRSLLMPVNRECGIRELMAACRSYFDKTGRRISFEYAMIDSINDTRYHARELCKLLRGAPWHLNLILLNDVQERVLQSSPPEAIKVFTQILEAGGVNFTFRRRLGTDIDAACGQLRRSGGITPRTGEI